MKSVTKDVIRGSQTRLIMKEVSILFGHNSTVTTEKYYCRHEEEKVCENAKGVW